MSNQLVTINLVVYNGGKYIRHCLSSIKRQTHRNLEVNVWDNASTDNTREIVKKEFPEFRLIESKKNLGMWPAQEELERQSVSEFIVVISVDIILDERFIEESVICMEKDYKIGALQAKIFQFKLSDLEGIQRPISRTIDTCGFKLFRSRRLINIGHGEKDWGQYNEEKEIFAVEGAVPVFRKQALEESRIQGHFIDPDFFWYVDDIDLTWRMRLLGWKQFYTPKVIAYHDRHTTKNLAENKLGFIGIRKQIPLFKRRLDWRNWALTIIKNDFLSNFLRDLPSIIWRQAQLWAYFVIFEPAMILELGNIARLLPRMLKRRRAVMKKTAVTPRQFRRWLK